ncbi:MAG: aminoglycoside O-phosphotransferase APH(9)-Ia [Chloroflexota bacterium]
MREPPPDLSPASLAESVGAHFGLAVAALSFLPLGHDALAWTYRVETAGGAPYFLKVRRGVMNPAALLAPRTLRDHGVARVVAPLPTTAGSLWAETAGYALVLYPFLAGTTGMAAGLSPAQWIAYGAALRQIHRTDAAPDLSRLLRRETFVPDGASMVRDLQARLVAGVPVDDPPTARLAAFWREHHAVVDTVLSRAESLGRRLARVAPPSVLCHADIHTANVMVDAAGEVWIVDWDEVMLAPRERDLMFVLGGGINRALVGPREEELFLQGYGAVETDPLALAYYRLAWAVGDIGAYGLQVVARPDPGPVSRQAAVESFLSLFAPGRIVDLALNAPW